MPHAVQPQGEKKTSPGLKTSEVHKVNGARAGSLSSKNAKAPFNMSAIAARPMRMVFLFTALVYVNYPAGQWGFQLA
jgi:hypothetical protein